MLCLFRISIFILVNKLKCITIEIFKPKCYNCCMLINCTKKLQDELMIKPEKEEVFDSLYSWHANIIKINRRKTMVLVNDASGYVVILRYLKAKDFKSMYILSQKSFMDPLCGMIWSTTVASLICPCLSHATHKGLLIKKA